MLQSGNGVRPRKIRLNSYSTVVEGFSHDRLISSISVLTIVKGFSMIIYFNIFIPTIILQKKNTTIIFSKKIFTFPTKYFASFSCYFIMGKVHRSYNSKRKALERIKAKRKERKKEIIRKPLSLHDKHGRLWFGGGAVPMDMACA